MGRAFDRAADVRYGVLAALPALIWPGVAAAKFAPADGATYRYTVVEEREAGRFTSERRIVFHRADKGWAAEVTVVSATATGTTDASAMSRRLLAALVGRTIRYDLNDAGMVVAVDDQDALIKLVIDAVAIAPGAEATAKRDAVADRTAKTLAALGPDMQRNLLSSLLLPVIAGALADAQPGTRPIALPAGSAMTQAVAELTGTETVTRVGDLLMISTTAEGPAPAASARIRIIQTRQVSTGWGLVMGNSRRTETWLTDTPDKKQVVTTYSNLEVSTFD